MPIVRPIAVSQRVDRIQTRGEVRDALDQRLVAWLRSGGFMPFPVPNTLMTRGPDDCVDKCALSHWLEILNPCAIVLSGGNDIGDFPERDLTEEHMLSWATGVQLPVLGICRGMQMMGNWAGARLIRVAGHVGTRHSLVPMDSMTFGVSRTVNSFHDWTLASLPDQFELMASSDDGAIEAMRHQTLPWEGWMWHPEREDEFSIEDMGRLKRLIFGNGKNV